MRKVIDLSNSRSSSKIPDIGHRAVRPLRLLESFDPFDYLLYLLRTDHPFRRAPPLNAARYALRLPLSSTVV